MEKVSIKEARTILKDKEKLMSDEEIFEILETLRFLVDSVIKQEVLSE